MKQVKAMYRSDIILARKISIRAAAATGRAPVEIPRQSQSSAG
jgi:hypothetical protein